MTRETKFKEAFKTSLAMVIVFAISLAMNWERPYWGGFAVAVISLSTIGQSLNKGAMRMLGTFLAVTVALTLIALFPQERWWFMAALSIYVGFCTYMYAGNKHQYFWYVAGFVCVVVCLDGGVNSDDAFNTAMLRAQETGLGILVYSLISVFLWPSSSRADFDAGTRNLISNQHQLYRAYLEMMSGKRSAGKAKSLRTLEVKERTRFGQLLDAAETDTYEIVELRRQWHQFKSQSTELMETMERWRESLKDVAELDLNSLLPNLNTLSSELDQRFTHLERVLAGETPGQVPQAIELLFDKGSVHTLSNFHKAALAVTRTQLQHLEYLTRSLFETLKNIKDFAPSQSHPSEAGVKRPGFVLDPDRLAGAVREMAGMWLAYLVWIYTMVPGGTGFVIMVSVIGLKMASMPQVSVWQLLLPAEISITFAGLLYIFVMPKLTSFAGLGLMIFIVVFAICYLFSAPRRGMGRMLGLIMFVTIIGVTNQQTYSFLSVATTVLMFVLVLALLAFTAYIPVSPRPEKAFLRLLGRFFRSCEYLMSTMRWNPQQRVTWLDRWRKNFHTREVSTLPRKLENWAPHINTAISQQQVQTIVTNLQALSYRMQELLDERGNPQAQFLVQELLADIRAWRIRVQETFQRLAEDPSAGKRKAFRTRLIEIMGHLDERIQGKVDKAADGQFNDRDGENFYRLLGAYRGVSEALGDCIESTGVIDLASWHEERF